MSGTRNVVGLRGDTLRVKDGAFGYGVALHGGIDVVVEGFETTAYGRTWNQTLKPGMYSNPTQLLVRDASGRGYAVPSHLLMRTDGRTGVTVERQSLRIGDLPATPFMEMDEVLTAEGERATVVLVDYLSLSRDPAANAYTVRGEGGDLRLPASQMALRERGRIWRRENGETVEFSGPADMGDFHRQVGEYDEVRNPEGSSYAWTLDDAIEGMRSAEVDGFYDTAPRAGETVHMIRFRDAAVGDAVREHTLAALGVGSAPGLR